MVGYIIPLLMTAALLAKHRNTALLNSATGADGKQGAI
jgi:ABC-2 type transport system permease protein